jgi:hypothetical protein
MPTPEPAPRIDRGQRVAGETHFEARADHDRIRFTHPVDGPLPVDEDSAPSSKTATPAENAAVSATELSPSASVWEAREDDHDGA